MKIQIASDLHLEFLSRTRATEFSLNDVEADVLVLAGDISSVPDGLMWASSTEVAPNVIYVPGNHEYYGAHLHKAALSMRGTAESISGFHLLDNDSVVIGGTRFLGTTLWTDFELNGTDAIRRSLAAASNYLNDFRCIRFGSTGWFIPQDSVVLHRAAVEWLTGKLSQPFDGSTVVVTHHCPHPMSVAERFRGDLLSPAFCSDLSALIEAYRPDVWIHGHTHDEFDYVVPWSDGTGGTRIVCNPCGYPGEREDAFQLGKVVVVG